MLNSENSVFPRVIPVPYWFIVELGTALSGNNRELMRNNDEKESHSAPITLYFSQITVISAVSHLSASFTPFGQF